MEVLDWSHSQRDNYIENSIREEVVESKEDESKEKHEKDLVKEMRIVVDSIKDHLIPQMPYKNTPKKMNVSLFKMYQGENINTKMNLRAQLKGTKMSKGESIQYYFTRVSQFREQSSAIGYSLD